MMRSLYTAASGMVAQQMNLDVISNNLSNVNTSGFKKSKVNFQDLLYQTIQPAGTEVGLGGEGAVSQIPTGVQIGLGTRVAATQRIFAGGAPQQTENPYDMYINGDGFFQVQMPDGSIAYTRDGSFKIDAEGKLVTADGYVLEPEIIIPEDAKSVSISPEGRVTVELFGRADGQFQEVGRIDLARFINPAGLSAQGQNLFKTTLASGPALVDQAGSNGLGVIKQGFLETSNVQMVDEMVGMIMAQRAYEASSKAIMTSDNMLGVASNLKR